MCAHSDDALDHGPSSAKGTRAPSAVTPFRGSNSTMRARAPNAAPLNHDTGACTSHVPPRHASRSKRAAATMRRPHTRAGSSPLLPGRKAAVDLRCEKANPYTPRCFTKWIWCLLAIVAGALSLFPSRRSRQAYLPRLSPPRGLMGTSPLGRGIYFHLPEPRSRRRPQGLRALLRL